MDLGGQYGVLALALHINNPASTISGIAGVQKLVTVDNWLS